MREEIDPVVFDHVKPFIEIDLTYIEKATPEALAAIKAFLANPGEDVTGLRLITMIDRANSLKHSFAHIEGFLKRLQGEEG